MATAGCRGVQGKLASSAPKVTGQCSTATYRNQWQLQVARQLALDCPLLETLLLLSPHQAAADALAPSLSCFVNKKRPSNSTPALIVSGF